MSGRITLHLDPGLGWTKPLTVACCGACGTELARHPNQDRAIRAARRRRCPGCGRRRARPSATASRPPPLPHPTGDPTRHSPPFSSPSCWFPWKESCHGSR
jgi:DNA-directed RNA polymerase subunit RPC12/RpoP